LDLKLLDGDGFTCRIVFLGLERTGLRSVGLSLVDGIAGRWGWNADRVRANRITPTRLARRNRAQ